MILVKDVLLMMEVSTVLAIDNIGILYTFGYFTGWEQYKNTGWKKFRTTSDQSSRDISGHTRADALDSELSGNFKVESRGQDVRTTHAQD